VRNERNIGVRGPNGNYWRVLMHASGEFFMWAAADDVRPREIVERCVEAFRRNPDAVMVHGPVQLTFVRHAGTAELPNDMDLTSGSAVERVRTFTTKLQHNAMLYGLYRREALLRARFGNHYGHDYLLCLQACLLGPVEYVTTPLIRYQQRGDALDGTMYPPEEVTAKDLFWYRGVRRYKCWLTLIVGSGYLLTRRGPRLTCRLAATAAYVTSFVNRYRRYLASESVFILVSPLAWLLGPFRPAGTRIKAMLKAVPADGHSTKDDR
jgi:hypothetical protein